MSYAVRNDGRGYRAVPSEAAIWADEWFSLELPPDPVVPLEQRVEAARVLRDGYLTNAAVRIAPLQDAVDLGSASAEDQALLALWKRYRVDLGRIEQQAGFPDDIDWPSEPVTNL